MGNERRAITRVYYLFGAKSWKMHLHTKLTDKAAFNSGHVRVG